MKLGLVLEGGASRAIFSAGVMDAFLDEGIRSDLVVGVSAGISNGMSYVSGQKGRALQTSKYFSDPRYMGLKHLLNPRKRSFYNLSFAFGTVPNEYIPYNHDAYAQSGILTLAGVTNIKTGQVEFMKVPAFDTTWKTLIASCALPILFQSVEINGNKYLDGGIADPIPFNKAFEEGCNKVIVITTREKSYVKDRDLGASLSASVYRKYPLVASLLKKRAPLYNQTLESLRQAEKEGRLFWIAPSDTSEWGRTDKSFEKLQAMYNEGYQTALNIMPQLKEYLSL
ncbi:MAG: patatin family protein [Clostridia bacterium]|nr:patatin family protein [Clostridia bacterium]